MSEALPLFESLLEERGGFLSFAFGFGVTLFTAIAGGAAIVAKAVCTTALVTSIFGGNFAGAGPCITASTISVVSAAIAGGITSYGASVGWQVEADGAAIGDHKRAVYAPIIDGSFGLSHNYDVDTHSLLNQTHGDMLKVHNTTILAVTWLETLSTANHTGGALDNLNMTQGRIVTLYDNGTIRAAIGQTTMLGSILDSFNDFKTNRYPASPLIMKRDMTVDWLSFNTYGENMKEGYDYSGNVGDVEYEVKTSAQGADWIAFDDEFAKTGTNSYHSKFCVGVSPTGQSAGQESMIVGEVYMNQWGGIDKECQSA